MTTLTMLVFLLTLLCPCVVIAQEEEEDADTAAIFEVFGAIIAEPDGSSKPNEITEPDDRVPEQNQNNPGGCECVPFYQCTENGTLDEDGVGQIDIKIDEPNFEEPERPCSHYMDFCCRQKSNEPSQPPENPSSIVPHREPACGIRNVDGVGFKVTGTNNEANYGEFPWMVAVIRKDHVVDGVDLRIMECGGSIIHQRVILTGAHCVRGKKDLLIRAGEWDTQTKKEQLPTQDRDVQQVIIHEKYYAGGLHNDIALLVLQKPLELNNVVDTICMPEDGEDMDGRNCISSGWGKNDFGKKGEYAVILKKVELPIVPRGACQNALRGTRLGQRFKLHQSFICAGGQKGIDTCKGDGGSPLVCPSKYNPNVYVQGGIVAWGIGCGEETPGVYVNVPLFRKWIDDKMASLQLA